MAKGGDENYPIKKFEVISLLCQNFEVVSLSKKWILKHSSNPKRSLGEGIIG
jgi:hypothetical protein